jgi:hypothetical protein
MRCLLLLPLLFTGPVMAQDGISQDDEEDDDEDWFEDDDFETDFEDDVGEDEPEVERIEEGDEAYDDEGTDDFEIDFEDDEDDEDIFEDDEEEEIAEDAIGGPGVDTAAIYRAFAADVKEFPPEEELIAWERYFDEHYKTLFRPRIDERMETLSSLLYGERIQDETATFVDAQDREIYISQPISLDSLDPRTRIRAGIEYGFPGYFSVMLDAEGQITREFSAHAGLRGRYTGVRLELGAKYALVKSARKDALLTVGLDLHLNTIPKAYPVVRPYLGGAKRFAIGNGLEVQGVVGAEWEVGRRIILVGGAHVYYRASDTVGIFAETSVYMQSGVGKGPYAFNLTTFGMRFIPGQVPMALNMAANVPYLQNYWGYHYGSIAIEGTFYPDLEQFPLLE